MGHAGETVVISPQSHHAGNHHPQVGGPSSKKSRSLAKLNIGGNGVGGLGHSHENSKGSSSKVSKKSHSHSTNSQPQSKAINVGKGRQGNSCSPNSNKASPGSLQHFHQQHLMKQSRHWNASTSRQKSFSPPTLHPMPTGEGNSRTASPVLPGSKMKEHFYAGARFETHPSHIGLPVPPSHWTAPLQRSQSQPSSPVPVSVPQKGISVDLATLFGYSSTDTALKSASFPGERMMGALVKMEDERKQKQQELIEKENVSIVGQNCFGSRAKAQVTTTDNKSSSAGKSIAINETDELKKALGLAFTSPVRAVAPISCGLSHGSELSPSRYQDISDQLKTLLKVAA